MKDPSHVRHGLRFGFVKPKYAWRKTIPEGYKRYARGQKEKKQTITVVPLYGNDWVSLRVRAVVRVGRCRRRVRHGWRDDSRKEQIAERRDNYNCEYLFHCHSFLGTRA